MAVVLRTGNRWLRGLIAERSRRLTVGIVILVAIVIAVSLYDPRLALVPLLIAKNPLRRLARRYEDARRGRDAEEAVGKTLALLPASFTVINDVEFEGFNVDHVVIGPTGIWAIETKSYRGAIEEREDGVRRDGRRLFRDPRRQARSGAVALSRRLQKATGRRYWVEPLVCLPVASVPAGGLPDACVVEPRHLLSRLRWRRRHLSDEERRRIATALDSESRTRRAA